MEPEINPTSPESTPAIVLRHTKRWITIVIGISILGFGLAAILLPFIPAFIIVPVGLAILATELVWAKHLLKKVKEKLGIADATDSTGEPK